MCGCKPTVGSNPTATASHQRKRRFEPHGPDRRFCWWSHFWSQFGRREPLGGRSLRFVAVRGSPLQPDYARYTPLKRNMIELARRVGMSRDGLYKALSEDGNPTWSTILKVTNALDLRFELHTVA